MLFLLREIARMQIVKCENMNASFSGAWFFEWVNNVCYFRLRRRRRQGTLRPR